MKYKQLKLMISALIFLVGLWMNIYFSTNLHFLLSGKMKVLTFIPIKSCFESMAASGQHLSLFFYLQGFILLCSIYFYLANMKPYQSDLEAITPDIATPVRAGQMQFGSSRWLTEDEKNKGFKSIKLRRNELKIIMERTRQDEEKESQSKEKNLSQGEALQNLPERSNEKSNEKDLSETDTQEYPLPKLNQGGIVVGFHQEGDTETIFYIDEDTHKRLWGR